MKFTRYDLCFAVTAFVVVAGHACYLDTPYINHECIFSEATRSLRDPHYEAGMEKYWAAQANPLGYSLFAALLTSLLRLDVTYWSMRLPSVIGCVAILWTGRCFASSLQMRPSLYLCWAAATVANPLVWLYTGEATADILPVAFMGLAFWCCYQGRLRPLYHLAGGLMFALAVLVKLPPLLLGLGIAYLVYIERKPVHIPTFVRHMLPYLLLPTLMMGAYYIAIWHYYGVLFLGDEFKRIHFGRSYNRYFLNILLLYASYLALALGPLVFFTYVRIASHSSRRNLVACSAGALLAGIVALPLVHDFRLGEMDLGVTMPTYLATAIYGFGVSLFVLLMSGLVRDAYSERGQVARFVLAAIVPFLLVSSTTRPAQRYLLLCLPLASFYIVWSAQERGRKIAYCLTVVAVLMFAPVSFLLANSQIVQGAAAERMAQWVIAHGDPARTNPGSIAFHAGQHFPPLNTIVSDYTIDRALPGGVTADHSETVSLFGHEFYTHYYFRTPGNYTAPAQVTP